MIIKIGGIEIDQLSNVKEINQLRVGLDSLDLDTPLKGLSWLNELSLEDKMEFLSIIKDYGVDSILSFFTFGIF